MEKQSPTHISMVNRSRTHTPAAIQGGVGAISSQVIVEVGRCTCCVLLCGDPSVVLSWRYGKQIHSVVILGLFVLGHEVVFDVFKFLSWLFGKQCRSVVTELPFVLGHEVLLVALHDISWTVGKQFGVVAWLQHFQPGHYVVSLPFARQPWFYVFADIGRFEVDGRRCQVRRGRGNQQCRRNGSLL